MTNLIYWSDEYELEVPEVDAQHRFLARLLNVCIDSAERLRPKETIRANLENLKAYAMWHFACEEDLMAIYCFPGLEDHREDHLHLMALLNKEIYSPKTWTLNLPRLLHAWFGGHSFGFDRKMARYINIRRAGLPELPVT